MSKKDFFEKVKINENGDIKTVVVEKTGETKQVSSQYEFFNLVQPSVEGKIKITFE